jgi:hypothetical protein
MGDIVSVCRADIGADKPLRELFDRHGRRMCVSPRIVQVHEELAGMPTFEGSLELVRHYGANVTRLLAGTFRGTARTAMAFVVFLAGVYSLSVHRERLRMWDGHRLGARRR